VRDHVRVLRGRRWYVALALVAALSASGCGDASPESPPSGVDELVVPTPSPDPADFVTGVDNPWLPLASGARWTYEATGVTPGAVTVSVSDQTETVAGVATTVVTRSDPTGAEVVDYYAQDRGGNVWWLGRQGEWRAGEDGAQAGLAMPADPRLGDGWRAAYAEGVVDVRAEVVTLDQVVSVPAGRFSDLVGIDTSDPLTPGVATRSYYASGTGLVEEVSTQGPTSLLQLESGPD
jgi:hypothetical protein